MMRMNTPWILALGMVLLLSGMATAQSDTRTLLESSFDETGLLKEEFAPQLEYANQQFSQLPGPVKSIFGNQTIEVELKLNDGSVETLGIITKDEAISLLTYGLPIKETLKVWIDEETANTIANSSDIQTAFTNAVNQKKLKYEGITADAQFTTFIADLVVFASTVINAFKHALGLI